MKPGLRWQFVDDPIADLVELPCWTPYQAKTEFLIRFHRLTKTD
jgi:hypothetical protein